MQSTKSEIESLGSQFNVLLSTLANFQHRIDKKNGGAMRDRTADLLRAKQALSQLSYSPIFILLVFGGSGPI